MLLLLQLGLLEVLCHQTSKIFILKSLNVSKLRNSESWINTFRRCCKYTKRACRVNAMTDTVKTKTELIEEIKLNNTETVVVDSEEIVERRF